MYRKGEVSYLVLPLPDRVQIQPDDSPAAAQAFLAFLRKRHSVRDFSPRLVPEAAITACIQATATAPSGANLQPWQFAAISNPAMKARIHEVAEDEERAFHAGGARAMTGWPRRDPSAPGLPSRI